MARKNFRNRLLLCVLSLVPVIVVVTVVLQRYSDSATADWRRSLPDGFDFSNRGNKRLSKPAARLCPNGMACPDNHFSFSIQSGAANVVAPKICLQNKMVLGTAVRNAGVGINVVILNGKTGELIKTGNFDMYAGDVNPLIELLKSIETGSVVMMASYDEPASKLTDEARKLIAELGSSKVQALGFRDNWVFVGGKGAAMDSGFEKYKKNDRASNKYEDWPEILELKGCIPRFME
ncbi:putative protein FAM3C-like [Scophthalmus maximus]|nr:putative protein FAM3C-like [Scophthalmus maximus]